MKIVPDVDRLCQQRLKVAFTAVLGLTLIGAVEVNASGRAEVAAGSAPREPLSEPEPSLMSELRPGLALRLLWPRQTLQFGVEGRAYYRTPNLLGLDRPLFLLRASAGHGYEASQRLELATSASITRGEVDYTSAALAFGTGTPAGELSNPVIGVVVAEGRTGFTWQGSRQYRLASSAFIAHSEPLGNVETFPTTTSLGVDSEQRLQLDPRSFLGLLVSFTRHEVDPGVGWLVIPAEVGVTHELDPRTTLEVYAGASWVDPDEDPELSIVQGSALELPPGSIPVESELQARVREERTASVFPRGRVELEHDLRPQRRTLLTCRLAATVDAVLDPTLGTVRPLAGIESALIGRFGQDFSLSLTASGYATTTREERSGPGVSDTALNFNATARHRISDELTFDFGARMSTRGSYLFDSDFRPFDRQIWAFAGLSASFGLLSSERPTTLGE